MVAGDAEHRLRHEKTKGFLGCSELVVRSQVIAEAACNGFFDGVVPKVAAVKSDGVRLMCKPDDVADELVTVHIAGADVSVIKRGNLHIRPLVGDTNGD